MPALWWGHVAEASLQFACFAAVAAVLDALVARFVAPELRAALWLAVLAKLIFPDAFPPALRWSVPAVIVPYGLPESAWATEAATPGWMVMAGFVVWLLGVVLIASVGCTRYRRMRRRRWERSEPAPASVQELADDLARRLGLGRAAPVRAFSGPGGPVLLGYLRPVVLVPGTLLEPDREEELELALLHELAHVKRRDPLWSFSCLGVQVLYWFHPLAWWVCRRLALLRELSCDRAVGRALGGDTRTYRRTLLSLARETPALAQVRLAADHGGLTFLSPRSQLVARLRALERPIPRSLVFCRARAMLLFGALFTCWPPKAPALVTPFPHDVPPLEDLEGCLRLRYAVLARMALSEDVEGTELAPMLSIPTRSNPKEDLPR